MDVAICDDDRKICSLFEKKMNAIYQKPSVRSFYDGDDLWDAARRETGWAPDVLLLDVRMERMDGMELARKLRGIGWKTILIFITAYADYVFDAFDVGAFHYLVKPVSGEKLEEVLRRAERELEQIRAGATGALPEAVERDGREERRIVVKRAGVHTAVKVSDILYAEVFNRKVVLHTAAEDIEYYGRLKGLEEELGDDFYRPHRAYLVNLRHVVRYDSSAVFLEKGRVVMAKQNYAGFVKAFLAFLKRERGRALEDGRHGG